jgi:4-amino-4-deoxy-L-arabinose transferase-like glycosyltransferase
MNLQNKLFWLVAGSLILVYILGLFLHLMDADPTQYATISRQALVSGEYLKFYYRDENYLDKPPLIFWLSALSYSLLGISDLAYRLPSFLAACLGVWATYRLAKLYYAEQTARISALLLASCQAYILFNHDVRTDTLLTGWTIFAVWHIAEFTENHKFKHIFWGFLGLALAMLAKGMVGLMVAGLGFSLHFLLTRQWQNFLRWQWLAGVGIVGICLLPMCVGLYEQYGTHGLRFFFWIQSFGRITGENEWKNDADITFLTHTLLWAFLPWCLLFFIALFREVASLFKTRLAPLREGITLGGFLLPHFIFSLSQYQLPHYGFVLYPFAAIITARYVTQILDSTRLFRIWLWVQGFVIAVVWGIAGILTLYIFPMTEIWKWLITGSFLTVSLLLILRKPNSRFERLVLSGVMTIAGANFIMNVHVYPALFTYQSYRLAAEDAMARKEPLCWQAQEYFPSMDVYSRRIVPDFSTALRENPSGTALLVYVDEANRTELLKTYPDMKVLETYDHFHISTLTLEFLDPQTRTSQTEKRYLVSVISHQ